MNNRRGNLTGDRVPRPLASSNPFAILNSIASRHMRSLSLMVSYKLKSSQNGNKM
jgi:hypothetical protein